MSVEVAGDVVAVCGECLLCVVVQMVGGEFK